LARPTKIGSVLVLTGYERAGILFRNGFPRNRPLIRRSDGIFRRKVLRQGLATGQLRIAKRAAGGWIGHLSVCCSKSFGSDVPFFRGCADQQVSRGGGGAAK